MNFVPPCLKGINITVFSFSQEFSVLALAVVVDNEKCSQELAANNQQCYLKIKLIVGILKLATISAHTCIYNNTDVI